MQMPELDRRSVLKLVAGLAAVLGQGTTLTAADATTLAQLIGLGSAQESWLADITPAEQAELRRALEDAGKGPVSPATVQLLARVLGARSRLFAYVAYPQVNDKRSLCDGLLRE